ncbi:hypothetical protein, partial [Bordetella pertussis]|uniref:hypothetical protein n=1 Tax=Bordetella pertussis TaxID=520 RepID=UPI0012B164E8
MAQLPAQGLGLRQRRRARRIDLDAVPGMLSHADAQWPLERLVQGARSMPAIASSAAAVSRTLRLSTPSPAMPPHA